MKINVVEFGTTVRIERTEGPNGHSFYLEVADANRLAFALLTRLGQRQADPETLVKLLYPGACTQWVASEGLHIVFPDLRLLADGIGAGKTLKDAWLSAFDTVRLEELARNV